MIALLTARELAVLQLTASDVPTAEIAQGLDSTVPEIAAMMSKIRRKLQVGSTEAAVRRLLPLPEESTGEG